MGLWSKGFNRNKTGEFRKETTGELFTTLDKINEFINNCFSSKGYPDFKCTHTVDTNLNCTWSFIDTSDETLVYQLIQNVKFDDVTYSIMLDMYMSLYLQKESDKRMKLLHENISDNMFEYLSSLITDNKNKEDELFKVR